jgi:UDP-N-acetylmuramate dehydrogenase
VAVRERILRSVAIVIRDGVPLAPFTTLELGGPARHFVEAADEGAIIEALRWAEDRKLPVAIVGGGSNLVVSDAGFDGLVVRIATRGLRFETSGGDATVTAAAGEPWDALVAEAVGRGLGGVECLSGIPGLVGATPIQNVGAYGQEVAETIRSVRILERGVWQTRELSPDECGFGYRDSSFKREPARFVVLAVTFGLSRRVPLLRYRELAETLAKASDGGAHPTVADVRAAVLALRAGKSMLVNAGDPNRRSVGSFFMNPILPAEEAEAVAARAGDDGLRMPHWPASDGRVKLSAGWLIERAGIGKGLRRGPIGVSSAHALALVHHGGGTTAALLALAREIGQAVRSRFGVTLVPEPTFVGVAWNLDVG